MNTEEIYIIAILLILCAIFLTQIVLYNRLKAKNENQAKTINDFAKQCVRKDLPGGKPPARTFKKDPRFKPHWCQRRSEGGPIRTSSYSGASISENPDTWDNRDSTGLAYCSYCGGIHPEDAISQIYKGAEVLWTGKAYKRYIRVQVGENRIEQKKVYLQHFSEDQSNRFNKALGDMAIPSTDKEEEESE